MYTKGEICTRKLSMYIDILNDKCAKNHLKMRSFDWFLKMLKFDQKVKKSSGKNYVLVL